MITDMKHSKANECQRLEQVKGLNLVAIDDDDGDDNDRLCQ
jgi:hypothetical protein